MTKITIFKKDDKIFEFQIKGHSGFAESGKDIVCSAISTAGQMTLLGLKEVLGVEVDFDIQDGFMRVEVISGAERSEVQTLLATFEKTIESFVKDYAKFVKMEVRDYVY